MAPALEDVDVIDLTTPSDTPEIVDDSKPLSKANSKARRRKRSEANGGRNDSRKDESLSGNGDRNRRERTRGEDAHHNGRRDQRERKEKDGRRRERSKSPRMKRRRSRSRSPRRKTPPPSATQSLFFVDLNPVQVQPGVLPATANLGPHSDGQPSLLLPSHVSVYGTTPAEIIPDLKGGESDDFIEFVDDDVLDSKFVRYFDEPANDMNEPSTSKIICRNCREEGHKALQCAVKICLTCGVRNEHITRSCPISKVCFSCGMKGHINSGCPNPQKRRTNAEYDDCDRCGLQSHKANECPTLWRLYEYLSDAQKADVLRARHAKRGLPFGQGGEGFIADDEWCYNCGGSGHLGDECRGVSRAPDAPNEPSAFGEYNVMSGPFYDPVAEPARTTIPRGPRDWESNEKIPDGWGQNAPLSVGKKSKAKERARLERQARYQEKDDPDDWFGRARGGRVGGVSKPPSGGGQNRMKGNGPADSRANANGSGSHAKRMKFDLSIKGASRNDTGYRGGGNSSLVDRISDPAIGSSGSQRHPLPRKPSSNSRDMHTGEGSGPRYKGGYSR